MLRRCRFIALVAPLLCGSVACHGQVTLAVTPAQVPMSELWSPPSAQAMDTMNGPWGAEHAPDCGAAFTFITSKGTGSNPGMNVRDEAGREWSVKQPPIITAGAEGPVEVALSRILSAVGYHQPQIYFLPTFQVKDSAGTRCELGGRFRLKDPHLRELGPWSWQKNPFVGTPPFQGLLVIMAMFNSSDLKDSNNSVYDARETPGGIERWWVTRDIGSALGETGGLSPRRANPDLFDHEPFITGIKNGFVDFNHHSPYADVLQERVRPSDVAWAANLLGALTDRQWSDAFRSAGFEPALADRFIRRLHEKISEARQLSAAPSLAFFRPVVTKEVPQW